MNTFKKAVFAATITLTATLGYGQSGNTFQGVNAGVNNTTGIYNSFFGYYAGFKNTIRSHNAAFGAYAGGYDSTGYLNTYIGSFSGTYNTGQSNTLLGRSSGYSNTGNYNSLVGNYVGNANTGSYNSFLGAYTGRYNAGNLNTFIGYSIGHNNTGDQNTFVGYSIGNSNTGANNTFLGSRSGAKNTSGHSNTFVGYRSGYHNTTGLSNLFAGYDAGSTNTTGDFNTILGYGADVTGNNLSNATAIGNGTHVNASNKVWIGNGAIQTIGGTQPWSNPSDQRYKTSIEDDAHALDFIMALEPKTYQFNMTKLVQEQLDQIKALQAAAPKENPVGPEDARRLEAAKAEHQRLQQQLLEGAQKRSETFETGLLAQQVEAAMKATGYTRFNGLSKPQNENDHYSLAYGTFVVPLIGAVQEQQAQLDEKDRQIEALEQRLETLEHLLLQSSTNSGQRALEQPATVNTALDADELVRVFPNPATDHLTIELQNTSPDATEVVILDATGKVVKTIVSGPLSPGKNSFETPITDLNSGNYFLKIEQNGKVATQPFIIK